MRKTFTSLLFKIAMIVLAVESLILASLGYVYNHRFSETIDQRIREQLVLPGILMNRQLLRYQSVSDAQVMTHLVGNEFIAGVVADAQGLIYYATDARRVGSHIRTLPALAALLDPAPSTEHPNISEIHEEGQRYLCSVTPLVAVEGQEPFFYAFIKVRTTLSERNKAQILKLLVAGSLLCILLTSALILLFARQVITAPLKRLEHLTTNVAGGGKELRWGLQRNDEIGRLAARFLSMRKAIGSQIETLESFNQQLEARVERRTQELQANMARLKQEIREREKAEAEVLISKHQFDAFMNHLPALAYMKDSDGRYVYVNSGYRKLLRIDKAVSRDQTDLQLWPLDEASRLIEKDREVMRIGQPVITTDVMTVGGVRRHYLVSRFPVYRKNQDALLGGVAIDISERVSAEEERLRLTAQLQHAQKMEALGTLAGGVAHDLNNILSGLTSYPELILMDMDDDSPLKKPMQTIHKSGQRAAAIVQDLLTLARRGVTSTEAVDINQVVSEYTKSPEHMELRKRYPGIRFKTNLPKDLMLVMGSRAHLAKTVMNLVTNAAEAITQNGTVGVRTRNQYLDTALPGYDDVDEGDYVVLTVSDDGPGIVAEDLERIFEPFYTKKQMGRSGTGLGLAVVWSTVKDHRGYVDLHSQAGQGARFELYFPAHRRPAMGVPKAPRTLDALRGRGESILVVDDIAEQREIAAQILTRLGYRVAMVDGGEAAVEYVRSHKVNLLLLDMIMNPGIDGLETYRRIVAIKPGQKAVIASGFSQTDRVHKTIQLGAGAYIKKPYTIQKLGQTIKAVLTNP